MPKNSAERCFIMRKSVFAVLAALLVFGVSACSLFQEECSDCNGTGKTVSFLGVSIECRACNGKGYK